MKIILLYEMKRLHMSFVCFFSVKSTTYLTLPVVEQEPYVIPEERRKTQGEKYRYKEDEKYMVPEKATVYQNPECTQTDLIQVVRKFVLTFVLPAPPQ